jgi:hypothetical protein
MEHKNNFQSVNEKASAAASNDEKKIRDLADEVFAGSDLNGTAVGERIKKHVLKAEISYRQGRKPALREQNVVNLVNHLVEAIDGPLYATTSATQVRQLRIALMVHVPHLVGSTALSDGKTTSDKMSPLEAAFVAFTLIHQKLHNAAFQVTPDEWDRARKDAVQQSKTSSEGGNAQTPTARVQMYTASSKGQDLRRLIKQRANAKSASEIDELVDSSMSVFGLEPLEAK